MPCGPMTASFTCSGSCPPGKSSVMSMVWPPDPRRLWRRQLHCTPQRRMGVGPTGNPESRITPYIDDVQRWWPDRGRPEWTDLWQAGPVRVFISVDMEGVAGIVDWAQCLA